MPSLYKIPINRLSGVGPKKAELFGRLGADSVGGLLRIYPRAYEDWSMPLSIERAAQEQRACVSAEVVRASAPARIRGNMMIFRLVVTDGTDDMTVTLFNQRFVYEKLKKGGRFLFYGTVKRGFGGYEISSPAVSEQGNDRIRPVYPQTGELTSKQIENAMLQAVKMLPESFNDPLPQDIRERFDVCGLDFAIRSIHFPSSMQDAERARKRFAFEELLILQLGLGMICSGRQSCPSHHICEDHTAGFLRLLPFSLTGAQQRAINECINDMKQLPYPMNRLIQGDVGSGKTAVAAAVCYTAVKNGMQCAFMAPTEILARQHYEALSGLLEKTDVKLALLTGSTPAAEKRRINDLLMTGAVDLVIGTHALISDSVSFKKLGLVVTDEQHRFGVSQRAALISKGDSPHIMVMSATPIPRTLALMIFGDMELSVLDELPPGRQKTETYLIDSAKRQRVYGFIRDHISRGRQCYIVCPLVEKNDSGLISAEEYAELLESTPLKDCRMALMHGRLTSGEKERIMTEFASGRLDILIATTVIEVGVNVPNATVMLIENAERFGLSQLHQLRGRVGRGKEKSYCIMVSDASNPDSLQRLRVMCRTDNGFEIADEDLRLRGPGDFFGSRQHGLPELKTAQLSDMTLLENTRAAAASILSSDPLLSSKEHRPLRYEINRLFSSVNSNSSTVVSALP